MSRTRKHGYSGSKRFDKSCRNHGSCPACRGKRTHKNKRREPEMAMLSEIQPHNPKIDRGEE